MGKRFVFWFAVAVGVAGYPASLWLGDAAKRWVVAAQVLAVFVMAIGLALRWHLPAARNATFLIALRRRRRKAWRENQRLTIAAGVYRVAWWIAGGVAGGAEKPRGWNGLGPIYELPTGELFIYADPVRDTHARIKVMTGAGLVTVDVTREQLLRLAERSYDWAVPPQVALNGGPHHA